jgi:murein DD-endopeptidase MepM/ murein hydrolase activator NlpD
MQRFHPVQQRWKAHKTDYAAPTGTLYNNSFRRVENRLHCGNGNYVEVKHNAIFYTVPTYVKILVRQGQRVNQGDVIGRGVAGLATGPHVCYPFGKMGSGRCFEG